MIPIIYDTLLLLMLFILYRCGKEIAKTGKIWSRAGITAIITYTLNEGLRFGRGIDYNEYWRTYEEIGKGWDSTRDVVFVYVVKIFNDVGIPYQGFVLLCSMMFIIGVLSILKNCSQILSFSLPLFALFSLLEVENMVRWYLGFSFVLIGLSFLLKQKTLYFLMLCLLGCCFHIGLVLIPIMFYFIYLLKKPLLPPYIVIILYFAIGFFFQTESMLAFSDSINSLVGFSERADSYISRADYWLTGGNGGRFRAAFPRKTELVLILFIVWYGFKVAKTSKLHLVYSYNLFIVGLLLWPVANQIELLWRYDAPFYFFMSIVLAGIFWAVRSEKLIKQPILLYLFTIMTVLYVSQYFRGPFVRNPKLYMYVWNHTNETPMKMMGIWTDQNEKSANAAEKASK